MTKRAQNDKTCLKWQNMPKMMKIKPTFRTTRWNLEVKKKFKNFWYYAHETNEELETSSIHFLGLKRWQKRVWSVKSKPRKTGPKCPKRRPTKTGPKCPRRRPTKTGPKWPRRRPTKTGPKCSIRRPGECFRYEKSSN